MSLNSSKDFSSLERDYIVNLSQKNTDYVKQIEKQQELHSQFKNDKQYGYQYSVAIQIFAKIHYRVWSRKFLNQFRSVYIESLKKPVNYNHSSPLKQQHRLLNNSYVNSNSKIDWPFKDLYYMRQKSPQQTMLMQFVHMCATQIQSFFKKYITQKRHRQAIKRLTKITNAVNTIKRRWKTNRILSCKKIKEMRDNLKRINNQIQLEEDNPHRNAKKLNYLNEELIYSEEELRRIFHKLYQTGLWVFQINPLERKARQQKYQRNIVIKAKSNIPNNPIKKIIDQTLKFASKSENIQPNKNSPKSSTDLKSKHVNNLVPLKKIKTKQQITNNTERKSSGAFDEIPIKSKGTYILDDSSAISQQKQMIKKRQKTQDQSQQENQNLSQIKQPGKQKSKEKQKLNKRQKYDPRKAVEEAKKKKLLQKSQNQEQKKQVQGEVQVISRNTTITNQLKSELSNNQVNNRKTVKNLNSKNIKKQDINTPSIAQNKSSITQNKSSVSIKPKGKQVQSKVKCWNKKPSLNQNYSSHFQQQNQYIDNKDYYEVQQRRFKRVQQKISNNQYQRPGQQYHKKEIETYDIRRFHNQQPQIKPSTHIQINTNNSLQNDKYQRLKSNFNNNMRQIMNKISDQRKRQTKKQAYRPFQQLEDAYNNQYGNRYQSLMPKIGLLQAARRAQRDKRIPVMSQDNQNIKNLMAQIPKSFWKSAKIIQDRFKQFIE